MQISGKNDLLIPYEHQLAVAENLNAELHT
jgi:hypothetical protein